MEGSMAGFAGNAAGTVPLRERSLDCPPPSQTRPVSIYEEHAHAVEEWHESCHDFLRAHDRKAKAQQTLAQVNERLAKTVSLLSTDPTCNKAEQAQSRY